MREIGHVLDFHVPDHMSVQVEGVAIDSRTVKKGMLFFALQGERVDGHHFIDEAFQRGACGAVVRKSKFSSSGSYGRGVLISVEDPLEALQNVATHFRKQLSIPVIAVTGTNGKTTTKEMIAAVLETRFRVMKSPGNYNNQIGLALSICDWDRNGEIGVVEMGTNHFGEIHRLCQIAQPTHGVITNIGKGHLEFFGHIEGVSRAKAELLEYLGEKGEAFINGDDIYLYPLKNIVKKTVTYGFSDRCDIRGQMLSEANGSGFSRMRIGKNTLKISVPGQFNLYNGLAAVSVGRQFGISWKEIKKILEGYRPLEKRMEVLRFSEIVILNDTYNANPTSLQEALKVLKTFQKGGRKIVVLGDMLELGKKSKEEHRMIGEWIVDYHVDMFFSYGPEMKSAAEHAKALGFKKVNHYDLKEDLINELLSILQEKDVVLVKGSRGMQMEEVVERLRNILQTGSKE